MYKLSGTSIIGFARGKLAEAGFTAIDPSTGKTLEPRYSHASTAEVYEAADLAYRAFHHYRNASGKVKGKFLRRIAANIEQLDETLTPRAVAETALPVARIRSETQRTCNQLRLFAELVEEGSWVDARIDSADPNRTPVRKPDVRSLLKPLGPVVVFCASNFPLAFSVAGGDTASALAAGNPVIVKAHHAHPGTAELVGLAVSEAVRHCELPEGVFSVLFGPGNGVGTQLVKHPLIKAGGFTGSRAGGLALLQAAASRTEPIPFYAEMSSVNPIFIFPGALAERAGDIAAGLHASVTLGAGQFCTNPGLIFLPQDGSEEFVNKLRELISATPDFTMLTLGISDAYCHGIDKLVRSSRVKLIAGPERIKEGCGACAALLQTTVESFLADEDLSAEVFGPSTLLITYAETSQLIEVARRLEGQLTATIHATQTELRRATELAGLLEQKAGRILVNGFPTGVEVGHAMVHGGPFPATSDGRSTSVGTRAAFRFTRTVCYQDYPDFALPEELKNDNPLGIWRLIDGKLTRKAI